VIATGIAALVIPLAVTLAAMAGFAASAGDGTPQAATNPDAPTSARPHHINRGLMVFSGVVAVLTALATERWWLIALVAPLAALPVWSAIREGPAITTRRPTFLDATLHSLRINWLPVFLVTIVVFITARTDAGFIVPVVLVIAGIPLGAWIDRPATARASAWRAVAAAGAVALAFPLLVVERQSPTELWRAGTATATPDRSSARSPPAPSRRSSSAGPWR
jgi:hypothetical protein